MVAAIGADTKFAAQKRPSILIVDDELPIRQQLGVGLAQRGYDSQTAENGVRGLELIEAARLRGRPHHCAIFDLRLPDIDGIRLIELVKTTYPDTPTIAISGFGQEYQTRSLQRYENCAYMDKPFDMDRLVERIQQFGLRPESKPAPTRATATSLQTRSAYLFLKTASPKNLCETMRRLRSSEGVCYCDLVRGEWDIVMLVQAPDEATLDRLIGHKLGTSGSDISRYEIRDLTRPVLSDEMSSFIRNHDRMLLSTPGIESREDRRRQPLTSAYVTVKVEKGMASSVYPQLYFQPGVLCCDVAAERDEMVLFIEGPGSDEIHRVAAGLRNFHGVRGATVLDLFETTCEYGDLIQLRWDD